jgi:hypothetical protein
MSADDLAARRQVESCRRLVEKARAAGGPDSPLALAAEVAITATVRVLDLEARVKQLENRLRALIARERSRRPRAPHARR